MQATRSPWAGHGIRSVLLAMASLAALPGARAGDIEALNMFRNVGFQQTGDGPALIDHGTFVSTAVSTLGTASYASATVTFGGPSSPLDLAMNSATSYGYQSGAFATKADMDAAFPQGSYQYALSDPGPEQLAAFDLGSDHYALSLPYLDGSSYSALQGADAGAPMALSFSPFVTDDAASFSFIFFTVYDYTEAQFVFVDGFLPPDTALEVLPANLLQAGHSYAYELIFSSRVLLPASGSNQADAQVGFELRTTGLFETAAAVPEPAGWALMLAGLAGVRARRSLRRRRHAGRASAPP
jgi:hypothetical protein